VAQRRTRKNSVPASETIRSLMDTAYREHSELLYMMHELSRMILTRVDKAMSANRVTHAQWWALMHIYERGEGRTQTELADLLEIGRASTGKLLERLEAKRWIERRPDKDDSRVRRVYLRPEVVPIFRLMTEEGKLLFQTFLEDISQTEEARLIGGLRKIRANAERAVELPVKERVVELPVKARKTARRR